ncbi:hypothetical protein [Streptomyces sp. NRRL S-350]|uniref:hypothetical protein n=1 Tax=Streptomyces sp. NRRL S-350 TaxID=1463902 RepID=UPI0004C26291|nr:hypothetical protein [Streptomyces sp. NRRL S-350]
MPGFQHAPHRTMRRRLARALISLLAGLTLLLGYSVAPASATEGDWINEGGPARSAEAMSAAVFQGDRFEILRGTDNRIWWRYRNGEWRVMPGGGITEHRPELAVILNGSTPRLAAFHLGTSREVYYSFLGGAAGNIWSPWAQVRGTAHASGNLVASSGVMGILLTTIRDNRVIVQEMRYRSGQLYFEPDWETMDDVHTHDRTLYYSQQVTLQSQVVNHRVTVNDRDYDTSVVVGRDQHVYIAHTIADADGLRGGVYSELPGGGLCESVAIGRGGDEVPTSDPGDPAYAAQQNVSIACISPQDHTLWVNRSSNGGFAWSGWSRTAGGNAYSTAGPEVDGDPGGQVFANISWSGGENSNLKQRMILMKRIQ